MEDTEKQPMKWKEPIWKISKGGGQVKRILRVSEINEIARHLKVDKQLLGKKFIDIRKKNMIRWLQFLTVSGMRFSEVYRFQQNKEWNGKPLFDPDRQTIFMPKPIFGDLGKGKVVNKERVVFLSDRGVFYTKIFLEEAYIPNFISTGMPATIPYLAHAFDSILRETTKSIGMPTRPFAMTRKVYKMDYSNGVYIKKVDDKGKYVYTKQQIEMKEQTSGVLVRSFRSTWESYLVSQFMSDPLQLLNIVGSFGHNRETAEEYYIVANQFDSEDLKEIAALTKGWGIIHTKKPEVKDNTEVKGEVND